MNKLVTVKFNVMIDGATHEVSHYCDIVKEDEDKLYLLDKDNNPLCIFQKKYIVPFDENNLCQIKILNEEIAEEKIVSKKKKLK